MGQFSGHQAFKILHILWTWLVQNSTSVCFPDINLTDLFISGLEVVLVNGGVDVTLGGKVIQRRVHFLLWHLRPHLQNNSQALCCERKSSSPDLTGSARDFVAVSKKWPVGWCCPCRRPAPRCCPGSGGTPDQAIVKTQPRCVKI